MKNFETIFPLVIKDEGTKYTNDKDDHGGPTKYGITLTDVRLHLKKDATAEDVKALTLDQAKNIYKSKYWNALSCDTLPAGVDYTCFDYGVNSGLGRPRKALQQFKSLSGTSLITAINNERTAFLKAIAAKPGQAKFLRGWLNRVQRVNDFSLQLAKKDNVSGPVAGTVVVAGTAAATAHPTVLQYLHSHPSIVIASAIGIALVVGLVVHFIRNKGK